MTGVTQPWVVRRIGRLNRCRCCVDGPRLELRVAFDAIVPSDGRLQNRCSSSPGDALLLEMRAAGRLGAGAPDVLGGAAPQEQPAEVALADARAVGEDGRREVVAQDAGRCDRQPRARGRARALARSRACASRPGFPAAVGR
jgi:hypothetical protein